MLLFISIEIEDMRMKGIRMLWAGWKRLGQFLGDFIGRLVLTIFYFTIFLPFGLGLRLFGDRLDIKSRAMPTWRERQTTDLTIEDGQRQS